MSILLSRLLKQSEAKLAADDAAEAEMLCAQAMNGALALDNVALAIEAGRMLRRIPDCQTDERAKAVAGFFDLIAQPPDGKPVPPLDDEILGLVANAPCIGARRVAEMLLDAGRREEAGRSLLCAGSLTQGDNEAIWHVASELAKSDRARLAAQLFERFFDLNPGSWVAGWNAHFWQMQFAMVEDVLAWLARLDMADNPDRAMVRDAILCFAPLVPDLSMATLRDLAVSHQTALSAAAIPMLHARPETGRRLRIGFLSRLFNLGNYVPIYLGLFPKLDRDRFEIVALFNGDVGKPMSSVCDCVDETIELGGLTAQQAAARIHDAHIDILLDCNGFGEIEGNRILDWKPAPIQVVWSNKDCTSGMTSMDWLLADESLATIDQAHFVERIYRLPCFHIDMPGIPRAEKPLPALRNGFVTLGAQIARLKLNRAMLTAWAGILHRVPDARLLIRYGKNEDSHAVIREELARLGIAPDRLDLRLQSDYPSYIATYDEIDLVLDRFPLSGGVTSLEALWLGVPILSYMGDSWAARRGGTLLRQLGLPELVAESVEHYIDLAVDLSRDVDRLAQCRQMLHERLAGASIGDATRIAQAMGDAFGHFWADYVISRGAAP